MLIFMGFLVNWGLADLCSFDCWLCFKLWAVGCLGYSLGFVSLHMHLSCDPGERGSSYPGPAFLMENHQNPKAEPNRITLFMTPAYTITVEIPLAKWKKMAKPKVTGEN